MKREERERGEKRRRQGGDDEGTRRGRGWWRGEVRRKREGER